MCWFCVARKTAGHPRPPAPVLDLPCPHGLTTPTAPTLALLFPDGAPVRWLLMDGYVNEIRDDQDHRPWQEGRWASMNGVRRLDERDASPLAPVNRLSIISTWAASGLHVGVLNWADLLGGECEKSRDERDMPAMSGGVSPWRIQVGCHALPPRLPQAASSWLPGLRSRSPVWRLGDVRPVVGPSTPDVAPVEFGRHDGTVWALAVLAGGRMRGGPRLHSIVVFDKGCRKGDMPDAL